MRNLSLLLSFLVVSVLQTSGNGFPVGYPISEALVQTGDNSWEQYSLWEYEIGSDITVTGLVRVQPYLRSEDGFVKSPGSYVFFAHDASSPQFVVEVQSQADVQDLITLASSLGHAVIDTRYSEGTDFYTVFLSSSNEQLFQQRADALAVIMEIYSPYSIKAYDVAFSSWPKYEYPLIPLSIYPQKDNLRSTPWGTLYTNSYPWVYSYSTNSWQFWINTNPNIAQLEFWMWDRNLNWIFVSSLSPMYYWSLESGDWRAL
jgi:hypothetical protein